MRDYFATVLRVVAFVPLVYYNQVTLFLLVVHKIASVHRIASCQWVVIQLYVVLSKS